MPKAKRLSAPTFDEVKQFASEAHIDSAIQKLNRRHADLQQLGDEQVRYDDQRRKNLEQNISDSILAIFGPNSPEYGRCRHHSIWHGPRQVGMSPHEIQARFTAGFSQTGMMLKGLTDRLEERRADFRSSRPADHIDRGGNEREAQKMPRAFVSYSYDSPAHRTWVMDFATRLRGDGVETILDKWELEPGDALPEFMERAVRDNDYVLIICTASYKNRSDRRVGGVGYEEDIMTAEALTERNQRKFKPVLRSGEWKDAAPTWLKGKLYVDLRGEPYSEENYQELLASLLGTRPKAPPVKSTVVTKVSTATQIPTSEVETEKRFEPIRILGIVDAEVGHPRNDGSRGSALYEVPFQFSRVPPYDWADLFVQNWNQPRRFTSMHRPGIAEVVGDRVILNGTTLDEVESYHHDTLKLALEETNKTYIEYLARARQKLEQEKNRREEHERSVREKAKQIKFD